jgi:hypothetical protein
MPIKKPKKKIRYRDTQKTTHALELLNSRALLALGNYLKYGIDDKAHESMEKLFKDYKKHKKEVHAALIGAFRFLTKDRFVPDPVWPDPLPSENPPSKQTVKETKKHINQIAKKIWKK